MFFGINSVKRPELKIHKTPLKDLTNEQLYDFIQDNDNRDPRDLSYICSEILKRMIKINEDGKCTDLTNTN